MDGRLADPADAAEVMVDEEMAELYDLEAGGPLQMQAFSMDQAEALFERIGTVELAACSTRPAPPHSLRR